MDHRRFFLLFNFKTCRELRQEETLPSPLTRTSIPWLSADLSPGSQGWKLMPQLSLSI